MRNLMLLLLLVLIVGQAAAQTPMPTQPPQPAVQAAINAGIIRQVGDTQTIGEITITLNWVYMDTTAIHLNYTISGKDYGLIRAITKARHMELRDTKGTRFYSANISPFTGQGENGNPDTNGVYTITRTLSFDTLLYSDSEAKPMNYFNQFESLPPSLDLIFELNNNGVVIPSSSPSASSVFSFAFTTPIYSTLVIEPDQTVIAGGLPMTLRKIEITPISTEIEVCSDLPKDKMWMISVPEVRN